MLFLELKKNLKKDFSGMRKIRLALLGDSATQMLNQGLRGAGYTVGIDLSIYESDYDQVDLQVYDPSSDLYASNPEFVLLVKSGDKLKSRFYSSDVRSHFFEIEIENLKHQIEYIKKISPDVKIIFSNYVEINDGVFGHFANKLDCSFLYQVRRINLEIMNLAASLSGVYVCDVACITSEMGAERSMDHRNRITSDMQFSLELVPRVASSVLGIVNATSGYVKKCLVLDLDNTLWGGIVGDDGIEGIQIGELGYGKAYSEIQRWALELKNRGVVLAVCSKNDVSLAKQVFEQHPDMTLRLEDIAVFVANRESKVSNLSMIQRTLNIGLDAIVFLDDNPFERGVVKHYFPEVCVPSLPDDPAEWLAYLSKQDYFEASSFTEADEFRTVQYQEEGKRVEHLSGFDNEEGFLESLDMVSEVNEFSAFNIPRSAQLLERSNQFNLRTIRYNEEELDDMMQNDNIHAFVVDLKDKFGNYGIISLVIAQESADELFIDSWVMSCRVLRRGVERMLLNTLVEYCKLKSLVKIVGEYRETKKNKLVSKHYSRLGFETDRTGRWHLDVKQYTPLKNFINLSEESK